MIYRLAPFSGLRRRYRYRAGSAAYEKRGVALFVPHWHKENCIQCNQCAFVCPHATIRPVLATADEVAAAPEGFETIPAMARRLTVPYLRIAA